MMKGKILILSAILIILTSFQNPYTINNAGAELIKEAKYNILIIEKSEMDFMVSEKKPENADFYINSNFFTSKNTIGLVVINGKRKNKRTKGGGFFYVVNGKATVKAKQCPTRTQYASQTILWGIDDNKKNESLCNTEHAKLNRYRTVIGENNKNQIIVISSNRIGLVTIDDILDIAVEYGLTEAILLDGGTSVDYKFSAKNGTAKFSSVPSSLKGSLNIKQPTTYICGSFN